MHKLLSDLKLNKFTCLILCIVFICLFKSQQCKATPSSQDTIKLQLKWRNQFQFAGYYAAKIKGYYAESGLNVKIIAGGPGVKVIDNVTTGKADIGVFDPGILTKERNFKKTPLVVLSTIMQSSGYCIISLKEKNILVPADLIGKKVMAEKNQRWSIFKAILLKEGLDTSKVEVIDRIHDSEDITTGRADAAVTYITSQPQRLRAMGYKINIMRPQEYGIDFYGDFIFSTRKFAYKDTKKTDEFIKASLKGWKYALAHQEEIISYILTLPDVKAYRVTREQLRYEAVEVRKLIMPNLVEIGHTNLGRWQYMLTLFQQLGVADKNFSLKDFIYDSTEYDKSRWFLPIVYASILILLIVITIIFINEQLRRRIKHSTKELQNEIDQRKTAEHLANENKEQLELILSTSNIGLWEFDVKTKETNFNQQFKKILGYSDVYDFSAKDFFEKIHPEDVNFTKALADTEANNTYPDKMIQFRIENASGNYIYVLSSWKLLYKEQEPLKISGVILSIEELKQKELQILKVSEELMHRNNELKKFAYITSHNLRAPVVNISSLSEMIIQTSLNTENTLIFDKIKESVQRLENTLDDLVEVVSQGKSSNLSLEKIDIESTIQSVLEAVKNQLPNADYQVNINLSVKALSVPKHHLLSIILNLLTNALKFKVEGRKTIINIESLNENETTVLKFSDNGIGIDLPKNQAKIFGLYQRINPQIAGKGIGLFITKSHMDSLNGKIEVKSDLNEGTTFILSFPNPAF